mgnify:CR=1 FL=1
MRLESCWRVAGELRCCFGELGCLKPPAKTEEFLASMVITIIMETDHVYDLYGPCSCRGWASACPAVAAEATLGHLTGSTPGSGGGACCSGWLPEFLKPLPFPVPLSLILGLLLPDLLLRRG